MKKMKLFPKTFLYTIILMTMIVIISHLLLYFLLPSFYIKEKNNSIDAVSNQAVEEMQKKSLSSNLELAKTLCDDYNATITIEVLDTVYVFSPTTRMTTTSVGVESYANDEENNQAETYQQIQLSPTFQDNSILSMREGLAFTSDTQSSILTREETITLDSGIEATLRFTMNLQPVEEASEVMFLILPYTITASIVLSLCAAFIYTRAITKPIKAICTSTKEMEQLHQDAHCDVVSKDEIGELATNINQLYTSLQHTIQSLEIEVDHVSKVEKTKVDFLRCASHELKTPLTSMSVILENMILKIGKYNDHDTYLRTCKDIVDHLSNMIKEILDASSVQGSEEANKKEIIQLDTWMKQCCEPYFVIAKSRNIHMELNLHTPYTLTCNPNLFHRVISNVLTNAVQYTDEYHAVYITLANSQLRIYNECEPLREEQLQHVCEAFYRPDFSRTKQTGGNGLGLYIVDQLLTLLDISYTFLPYEKGMCFTIYLKKA